MKTNKTIGENKPASEKQRCNREQVIPNNKGEIEEQAN